MALMDAGYGPRFQAGRRASMPWKRYVARQSAAGDDGVEAGTRRVGTTTSRSPDCARTIWIKDLALRTAGESLATINGGKGVPGEGEGVGGGGGGGGGVWGGGGDYPPMNGCPHGLRGVACSVASSQQAAGKPTRDGC